METVSALPQKPSASPGQVAEMRRLAMEMIAARKSAQFDRVVGGIGELKIDGEGNLVVEYIYPSGMQSSNQIRWKFSPDGTLVEGVHAPYIDAEKFEPEIWDRMDPGYADAIIVSLQSHMPQLKPKTQVRHPIAMKTKGRIIGILAHLFGKKYIAPGGADGI